jgi:AcrR family transcriptional regulator
MAPPPVPLRARNDEAKELRRTAIVDAARALLYRRPFSDVTVAAVAREAGLGKGTVYLYFRTKEELVLSIVSDELDGAFGALQGLLAANGACSADALAHLLVTALADRPLLVHLATVLHSVLEQNIDLATAIQFKRQLAAHMTDTGATLERCLPSLRAGDGRKVFLRLHAMLIGFRQLADHSPIIAEAIESAGLSEFDIDFATELEGALAALLRGMEMKA